MWAGRDGKFDPELKVYLNCEAIDVWVGLNGPAIVVEQALGKNPFAKELPSSLDVRRYCRPRRTGPCASCASPYRAFM